MAKVDVYQIVTDQILAALDAGVVPWRKEWTGFGGSTNLVSKKAYRGVNTLILELETGIRGYATNYWLTFRQAKGLKGSVRKGEKSTLIVFWQWLKQTEKDEDDQLVVKSRPLLRYYRVFNVDQCDLPDGVVPKPEPVPAMPETVAQTVIDGMPNPPVIVHNNGDRACYRGSEDTVILPHHNQFNTLAAYYSTAFYELAHSTAHESRLNRKQNKVAAYGSKEYGKEELIAEIASAFLCSDCGIAQEVITNQTAYIASWKEIIQADKRMVVTAAAQAQKAADYILGQQVTV